MWIIPKSLVLNGSRGTVEIISDLEEQSRICASLLFARSKPSRWQTWLRRWKTDGWSRFLFGRIVRPSPQNHSLIESAFLSLPILASRSHQPGSAREKRMRDICGLTSETGQAQLDLVDVSLKTSKGMYRWDSPQLSAIWKKWVMKCRGDYLARVKLGHRTSGSGCSSTVNWPTVDTCPDAPNLNSNKRNCPKSFKEGINWPTTTTTRDHKGCGNAVDRKDGKSRMDTIEAVALFGLPDWAKSRKSGSHRELCENWATPRSGKTTDEDAGAWKKRNETGDVATMPLGTQVQEWPTATSSTGGQEPEGDTGRKLTTVAKGKLNPRWVETLMGVPVGWCMPSCTKLNDREYYEKCDNRTDELRLLGNGVVPATAEKAFRELSCHC